MRKFPVRSIKKRRLYKTNEAAKVIGACEATIHRMVKNGLPVLDKDSRPFYIFGADLFAHVKKKNEKYRVVLKPDELFCINCKKGVKSIPEHFELKFTQRKIGKYGRQVFLKGRCENCNSKLNKFSTDRKVLELIQEGVIHQKHITGLIDIKNK